MIGERRPWRQWERFRRGTVESLSLGEGEGDARAARPGVAEAEKSMTVARGSVQTVWAFGRMVGRVVSGSKSWTCSLKCVQRMVTPWVADVLMCRRMRWPSFSVQRRRCGLRRARCCSVQRPVQSCPRWSISRWWKKRWWIARPSERSGPGWRRCTISARSCIRPSRSVARPGQLQRIYVCEQWGRPHRGHTPRTSAM